MDNKTAKFILEQLYAVLGDQLGVEFEIEIEEKKENVNSLGVA